ncbi:MAG TPA: hypothetical protein VLJ86_17565 [Ramlibacter sp.]|nr:hypothetical protein [Ramlibacter sp.]
MARRDDIDAVTEAIADLRRYVRAYPQACDTIAGIAAWWLQPRMAMSSPDVVAAALAALVENGEMECVCGPDGQVVYRAARPAGRGKCQVEPPGS